MFDCKSSWGVNSAPFFLAESLFGWTYYVFVFRYTWNLVVLGDYITAGVLCILFHISFGICQLCFLRTTFTMPGDIPPGFPEEFERKSLEFDLQGGTIVGIVSETNSEGRRRRCEKCATVKPDRCHHCSQCKRCILKMDHHCPWVNNCVGFHNYKFFVLFLTWTCITGYFVAGCFLSPMLRLFVQGDPETDIFVIITFIVCAVFAFGLSLFAGTHYYYSLRNVTTIEVLEKSMRRKENPYDIGTGANFEQVFGSNPLLWFFPVRNFAGNGLWFPQKHIVTSSEKNSLLTATV